MTTASITHKQLDAALERINDLGAGIHCILDYIANPGTTDYTEILEEVERIAINALNGSGAGSAA